MAFWEDDTSSRTPYLHCKMKWYRFRTVKSKLHYRATSRAESGEKRAAPPDQQIEPEFEAERGRRVGS
eukprot:2170355-Prymnesium_polylepis.1